MIYLNRACQVVLFAVLLAGCGKKELTEEQKREKAKASIGIDAWMTARDHVDALHDCRIAGFADLQKCALNEGILMPEESAKDSAARALSSMAEYKTTCNKNFSEAFCGELIGRAIRIEWRRLIYGKKSEIDNSADQDI
jgi:hypothetical protein